MVIDLLRLNKEQKEAVIHEKGPLLIVAGAGTGKTTVITQRIVNLIENKLAKPEEILAVTFTEKAAAEMEERVDRLLEYGYIDLWISTFHSFCEKVLRDNALDIGLTSDFKILDPTGNWLLMRQNLDKFDLKYYKALGNPTKFIQALISHFSHCKDQEVYPEDYLKYADDIKTRDDAPESEEIERIKEVANAYHTYQQIMLENSCLDFGDLINYCLKLFKKRPLILKKYRERFKYILVDEFQDTNWAQYELIKILASPNNNLMVSSDDDQCLIGDTLIETPTIPKKIKNLKGGEQVLTALGRGHIGVSTIKKVFFNKKNARMLTIKTKSGNTIKLTDNHKMFCYVPRTFGKGHYYVYLMYRQDIGWRIGVTNDLVTRLRLERSADKILAIKSFYTDADARYFETLLSLKYGIPTSCFKSRTGIVIKDELLEKLYKEISVEENVKRLANDLNIDLNFHHFCLDAVNRGNKLRIKINLRMCYRRYRSKDNAHKAKPLLLNSTIKHQVTLETSDKNIIEKLESSGFELLKAKNGKKIRIENKSAKYINKIAQKLQKITNGIIETKFNLGLKYDNQGKRWRSYYALIMPAKNLALGHCLPIKKGRDIIYDEIIKITSKNKEATVYDLEIENTHNFIANRIVVHNSIYKFRGASFSNILQFKNDFSRHSGTPQSEAKEVALIKNYRSSQNILDKAYHFIKQNNPDRLEYINKIDKKLVSNSKDEGVIEHIHTNNLDSEAGQVIKKIFEILKQDKTANYNDFAILVRANNSAIPFIKALERAELPYQFLASRGLYSKPIILDIISYLKLLDNYHESSAVYRILNLPFLEITDADIALLTRYSQKKTRSLFETLQELPLVQGISTKTQEKVNFLLGLIAKHSQLAREKNVSEILVAFLEDSDYLKYLVNNSTDGGKEKIDLLNQFYKKVKAFEEAVIEPSLNLFIKEINLELESGEEGKLEFDPEQGPDMIKVMTIHGAKGLEFKYVFLVSMVDKRFPSVERKDPIELPDELIKDIKPKGDIHLQEERRLCYVAITRAKKAIYFTSADDYGGQRKKKLSRFLVELGFTSEDAVAHSVLPTRLALGANSPHPNPSVRNRILPQYLPEHFSYSQLATFQKCPLQYKFSFILKVPTRGKFVFSFGKTMHNTLYEFLKQVNEQSSLKQENLFGFPSKKVIGVSDTPIFGCLTGIYEKNWIDEWYESKKQKEEYYKKGKQIIRDFYEDFTNNPPKILKINDTLALEMPFNLKIGGHTLYGVIDRIDEVKSSPSSPDGSSGRQCTIVDYKTGQSKNKLDLDAKEQLLIYQIAAKEVLHLEPKQLAYHYLDDGKKASFLGTDNELENQKIKIIEEIEKIKNSEFEPTPGWQCQYCDFKDICNFAKK